MDPLLKHENDIHVVSFYLSIYSFIYFWGHLYNFYKHWNSRKLLNKYKNISGIKRRSRIFMIFPEGDLHMKDGRSRIK